MEERIENFLKELTELTQKHELAIGGCGCCGSPYIMDMRTNKDLSFKGVEKVDLEYDLTMKKYTFAEPH